MSKKGLRILLSVIMAFSMAIPSFAVGNGIIPLPPKMPHQSEVTPFDEPATHGLLGYWSFDTLNGEVIPDESGNGLNGRFQGTPGVVDGILGSALEFNADKQLVLIDDPNNQFRFTHNDSYTISLWARSAESASGWQAMIQKGRRYGGVSYGLWLSTGNTINYGVCGNNFGDTLMPVNSWTHIVAVQDGVAGTRALYVNGRPAGTGSTVVRDELPPGELIIGGCDAQDAGEFFRGQIDEVMVFDHALSREEAKDIYLKAADVHTVSGQVLPGKTGAAVEGLTVSLYEQGNDQAVYETAVTGADGNYVLKDVKDGNYILKIAASEGVYIETKVELTVSGYDVKQDITLECEPDRHPIVFAVTPTDAKIRLIGPKGLIVPEKDGSYSLSNGSYSYTVRREGYRSQTGTITVADSKQTVTVALSKTATMIQFSEEEIFDRMKGGWIGEMAGVTWGAPTEFAYQRRIIPAIAVPVWKPEMINNGFIQDDLYVEVPFLDCMKHYGVTAHWDRLGEYFAKSNFGLAHANYYSRANLQKGIPAPDSGHYLNTKCCDDIDWQIEADSVGMMAIGQPEIAKDLSWRVGHVMNYGDGVYGGIFVSTMYAAAFTAGSVDEIIDVGLSGIPKNTKFYRMMDTVIKSYESGATWEETWALLEAPQWQDDRCTDPQNNDTFNIDAKINSAYILIGLLYGGGDLEKTMEISMRCGQDSDCNPSSAGGILGCYLGLKNIDEKWHKALDWNGQCFAFTNYTMQGCVNLNLKLARELIELTGGTIANGVWTINRTAESKVLIREQWPENETNPMPVLNATVVKDENDPTGRTYIFDANATDADGIEGYQWFFGDCTFEDGSQHTYTYPQDGVYTAVCYVTDGIGNTTQKHFKLFVNAEERPDSEVVVNTNPLPELIAHWTFDEIVDGKVIDATGNGHDGVISGTPGFIDGVSGKSIDFNTDGQLVTIPMDSAFQYGKDRSFSISTWVKIPALNGAWQAIMQTGRNGWMEYYGLWLSGDDSRFSFSGNSTNIKGTAPKPGVWHHVVAVQNGKAGTRTIYIDGVLSASGAAEPSASNIPLIIGGVGGSIGEYFKGQLDDIRFYNYALSQMEIDNLKNFNNAVYPIDGKLNAGESGAELGNVAINLYAASQPNALLCTAYTDKEGTFRFLQVPDGAYILKIAGNNKHNPVILNVTVNGAAISGLEITFDQVVDKSHLLTVIAAIENLNKSDFTAESWKPLSEALFSAKAVAANETATAQEVKKAYLTLVAARDNLVFNTIVSNPIPTVPSKPGDTQAPQTGDNDMMSLWFALLFVSGASIIGTAMCSQKKQVSSTETKLE